MDICGYAVDELPDITACLNCPNPDCTEPEKVWEAPCPHRPHLTRQWGVGLTVGKRGSPLARRPVHPEAKADLLRDVFGNPKRRRP